MYSRAVHRHQVKTSIFLLNNHMQYEAIKTIRKFRAITYLTEKQYNYSLSLYHFPQEANQKKTKPQTKQIQWQWSPAQGNEITSLVI